jgi:hypothetical protein
MKKTIVKPDGTEITIESKDKKLVQRVANNLEAELRKANEIRKIEPIDRIEM